MAAGCLMGSALALARRMIGHFLWDK